ncbi:putative uncharacterized protein WWC2-AS2 [Papio anubis]|uniref:putative uncharacterized protein WWC2-AS2 n=1 Tax=Papio anubis TaxID=9555 RepID=UPI0012AE38F8|nr:putative uncharacterized protein WWC2-AS2 [Papio anubis]
MPRAPPAPQGRSGVVGKRQAPGARPWVRDGGASAGRLALGDLGGDRGLRGGKRRNSRPAPESPAPRPEPPAAPSRPGAPGAGPRRLPVPGLPYWVRGSWPWTRPKSSPFRPAARPRISPHRSPAVARRCGRPRRRDPRRRRTSAVRRP